VKGQPVKKLGNGKVYVVEFWATWCGPCKESIPHLTELAKKYEGKATFVGVSAFEVPKPKDESYLPKVEAFVKEMGPKMEYTVAADGKEGFMGKNWMDAAGQGGIPTAFVVDQKGNIAWIGHPMIGLDSVVGKVIDGTFDAKAEADRQKKQREAAAERAKVFEPLLAKLKAKDHKGAVEEIDKLVAADPTKKNQLALTKFSELLFVDEVEAQKLAAELGDGIYKNVPPALNQLVWSLVEDASPVKNLDTALVIRLGERAVELTKSEDANVLDTLAVAYFRAKRLDDALATEKKAIERAEATSGFDADSLKEMKARLETYTTAKG
jgi:thiol-disulfide isomerase/thioredoxin